MIDLKLLIVGAGIILASVLMYNQYAKIANTPGITTLSKATLAFRLVISVLSIGLSIYGVFNSVFSFLIDNGANRLVSITVATTLAIAIASALEFLLVNSEKAIYESFFYGLKKFIAISLVVVIAQSINFVTMKANASALFDRIFTKETKIIDSIVLDTAKDTIEQNKMQIKLLQKQLSSVSVDADAIYKQSRGYSQYTQKYNRYKALANSYKLQKLKAKGNEWATKEIAKYEAKANAYKQKLEALKARATIKAKELARQRELELQSKIDTLLKRNMELSTKTIDRRNNKLKEAEARASNSSSYLGWVAFGIVVVSVFLSIVHAMTSDTTLISAKQNAIIQKAKDVELLEKMNALEYEMSVAKSQGVVTVQNTSRPTLDQNTDQSETEEQTESVFVSSLNLSSNKEEKIDINQELYKLALEHSVNGEHPNRATLKVLAHNKGLDVSRWTEKYQAYLNAMKAQDKVYQDGRKHFIKELKGGKDAQVA